MISNDAVDSEESLNRTLSPVPLMSLVIPAREPVMIESTAIDLSKFHFAHVIKVPHGTTFVASDDQSSTVCVNASGNIIHLITPTGYHIRSIRWPETEATMIDLFWCGALQVYLAATSISLYSLRYDQHQSLSIEKCLDFRLRDASLPMFITGNSYRLYWHCQFRHSIEIYTLQFVHLHSKELPPFLIDQRIEAMSSSDSYLVCHCQGSINKLIVLDPTSMSIVQEIDSNFHRIASLRCFDDENTLVLIGVRQDGDRRLMFLNVGREDESRMMVEKAMERDDDRVCVLPRSRDLIILNATAARLQYVKYRR